MREGFGQGDGGGQFGMQCASGDARRRASSIFSAYDNILEMVLVTDTELKIVYANAAVERVLGYKPEDLIGADAHALMPPNAMTPEEHKQKVAEYVRTDGKRKGDDAAPPHGGVPATPSSSTSSSTSPPTVVGTHGRMVRDELVRPKDSKGFGFFDRKKLKTCINL